MPLPLAHRPKLRAWLARALAQPRVAVSLVALAVLLAGLLFVRPNLDRKPADALSLATSAAVPSTYAAFTSDADFARGTRAGTSISGGALRFATVKGTRVWAGRNYEYAAWTSPWVTPTRTFAQLVPSWSASTPAGSWVQVLVQVRDGAGATSKVKDLGRWTLPDATFKRSSAGTQSDPVARVATDTLIANNRALKDYRFTVKLMRTAGGGAPVVKAIGAVTSTPNATMPATSTPISKTPISLAVPSYSQMIHRGHAPQYGSGGEAWCSPTSLAMVLGYYGRLPAASAYTWVPSGPDRWVDHVARQTFDHRYDGTGNWPFNTAYAATRTGEAFVTRLPSLRMAERFIRAGIPVVVSIKFAQGQLKGAPISSTSGHVVVLTGFTAAGNPIVNDPAAATNASVRRSYDRAQFEQAWLRGSSGMAYIIRDAKHPLPARPAGVRNW